MKTVITLRLGLLTAEGAEVVGEGEKNATRWVFDVDYTPSPETVSQAYRDDIWITLKLPYASTPIPRIISYSFSPLSENFGLAGVYVVESVENPLKIGLRAKTPCRYRVIIDTVK